MGRWSYSNKAEADWLKKMTVFELNKLGLLASDSWNRRAKYWKNNFTGEVSSIGYVVCTYAGNEFVLFDYVIAGKESISDRFNLTTTHCNFGGKRYWFKCSFMRNGVGCGRRVGVLYLKWGKFACRHCHDLTYDSKKLSGRFKAGGSIISIPDLEEAENASKRKFYNGKITRKYARYLKMEAKAKHAWAAYLGTVTQIMEEKDTRMKKKIKQYIEKKPRKRRKK